MNEKETVEVEHTPLAAAEQVHEKGHSPVVVSEYGPWMRRFIALLVLVAIGLMIGVLVVVNGIAQFQEEGKDRGFQSRAVNCRVIRLLGGEFDRNDPCLVPEVVQYYDPDEAPTTGVNSEGQQVNRRLLCAIITAHGGQSPDCDG